MSLMAMVITQKDGARNFWEFAETMVGVLRWDSRSMDLLEGVLAVEAEVAEVAADRSWWRCFFVIYDGNTVLFFIRPKNQILMLTHQKQQF